MTDTLSDVDGRTARRNRNRVAVLDAVLALFAEGDLDPNPEEVARRSGVSLRSVYRYVADRDDLVRAAIARHAERVAPLFELPDIGQGAFEERLRRFVAARLSLYEAVAATHRAARQRAPHNPLIAAQLDAGRRAMREQFEHHFARELAALAGRERRNIVLAADALTRIETIDSFRLEHGCSSRVTHAILADGLRRLLRSG